MYYLQSMKNRLPIFIDPIKSAQQRLDYVGIYPADKMVRLAESVSKIKTDVSCHISVFYDEQKIVVIKVQAKVDLDLLCQRCFQPMDAEIEINNQFSPVKNETQMMALPEYYDPAILNEYGEIDLLSLVEDELILSLPLAPKHNREDCDVSALKDVFGALPVEEEKPNSFAILAGLKKEKE